LEERPGSVDAFNFGTDKPVGQGPGGSLFIAVHQQGPPAGLSGQVEDFRSLERPAEDGDPDLVSGRDRPPAF
jgi:hypothetical protein